MAVNISPIQFHNEGLVEVVLQALAASGLDPNRLELEITEGVLLVEQETTMPILRQLHGLGVRIAMDDFGTGYSSMGYLRTFPFDKIKIDRSFVANMATDSSSMAIIRAVTGLSRSLGITTTAEGVETETEYNDVASKAVPKCKASFSATRFRQRKFPRSCDHFPTVHPMLPKNPGRTP